MEFYFPKLDRFIDIKIEDRRQEERERKMKNIYNVVGKEKQVTLQNYAEL